MIEACPGECADRRVGQGWAESLTVPPAPASETPAASTAYTEPPACQIPSTAACPSTPALCPTQPLRGARIDENLAVLRSRAEPRRQVHHATDRGVVQPVLVAADGGEHPWPRRCRNRSRAPLAPTHGEIAHGGMHLDRHPDRTQGGSGQASGAFIIIKASLELVAWPSWLAMIGPSTGYTLRSTGFCPRRKGGEIAQIAEDHRDLHALRVQQRLMTCLLDHFRHLRHLGAAGGGNGRAGRS